MTCAVEQTRDLSALVRWLIPTLNLFWCNRQTASYGYFIKQQETHSTLVKFFYKPSKGGVRLTTPAVAYHAIPSLYTQRMCQHCKRATPNRSSSTTPRGSRPKFFTYL